MWLNWETYYAPFLRCGLLQRHCGNSGVGSCAEWLVPSDQHLLGRRQKHTEEEQAAAVSVMFYFLFFGRISRELCEWKKSIPIGYILDYYIIFSIWRIYRSGEQVSGCRGSAPRGCYSRAPWGPEWWKRSVSRLSRSRFPACDTALWSERCCHSGKLGIFYSLQLHVNPQLPQNKELSLKRTEGKHGQILTAGHVMFLVWFFIVFWMFKISGKKETVELPSQLLRYAFLPTPHRWSPQAGVREAQFWGALQGIGGGAQLCFGPSWEPPFWPLAAPL